MLFVASLVPLFFVYSVLYIIRLSLFKPTLFNQGQQVLHWVGLGVSVSIVLWGLYLLRQSIFLFRHQPIKIPKTVTECEQPPVDGFSFLTTYVIPLLAFDTKTLEGVVLVFATLIIIGAFYIKTNLFYANPMLLIFGYKSYRIRVSGGNDNVTILSYRETIKKGDLLGLRDMGSNVYLARQMPKPNPPPSEKQKNEISSPQIVLSGQPRVLSA